MDGYDILSEIGKGGMGCVYMARDAYGNKVALKMMSAVAASQTDYLEMFQQEAQALQVLSHPSIVKIVGKPFSDESGNLFLPMEFVEGKTLAQIIQANGPFAETEAIDVFVKILDTFSYIHSKHCIHRDVKPSNVMIRPDGSICVIDFGIAKDSKTSTGKTIGRIVGTDGYMSPEQANGFNIDTRTDIYSLGCLLHYMLTGTHAINKKANDYETVRVILEDNFPRVADRGISITDKTQNAILKAVNKNMLLRFQTTTEFKEALLGTKTSQLNKITIGRANCDINIPVQYVSGQHLDVIWESVETTNAPTKYRIIIVDHSTNGTGVNGRKIKNEHYSFTLDKSIEECVKDISNLPQVMLAGLPEYTLDWSKVLMLLFERMDLPTSIVEESSSLADEPISLDTESSQKVEWWFYLLCFCIPLVGWILGHQLKQENPDKAKAANRSACWGFCVGFILSTCLNSL